MPTALPALQHDLRLIGLALAATEKSVQIVYERGLRPPEKLHEPWVERVTGQLLAAHDQLEQELARQPLDTRRAGLRQAHVTLGRGLALHAADAARGGAGGDDTRCRPPSRRRWRRCRSSAPRRTATPPTAPDDRAAGCLGTIRPSRDDPAF